MDSKINYELNYPMKVHFYRMKQSCKLSYWFPLWNHCSGKKRIPLFVFPVKIQFAAEGINGFENFKS